MNTIYLVILITMSTSNSYADRYYFPFKTIEECYSAIEHSKTYVPNGGDSETTVTAICTNTKAQINQFGMDK